MPQAQRAATPTPEQSAPSAADCDRLLTMVEQRQQPSASIRPETVRAYRSNANFQACRDGLDRLQRSASNKPGAAGEASAGGSQITVQQAAPDIRVQQAAPEIAVQQGQPTVTVHQQRPEIFVRQPRATVTVDIPQPEITIRMREPDVDVALARPEVSVNQPQPRVQVTRTDAKPQVSVQPQSSAEANVQVRPATQQPQVRFERAEPRIVVNQEGQPQVRFERMTSADRNAGPTADLARPGSDDQATATAAATDAARRPASAEVSAVGTPAAGRAAPAGAAQPQARIAAATAATAAAPSTMLSVSELTDYDLFNARGDQLGDVERVVQGADGRPKIVIGHGGFLGLGEKRVAVPVENIWISGDRLVVRGLTDDQIKAMPAWTENGSERQLGASQRIAVESRG